MTNTENKELENAIDTLDGQEGDSTGLEGRILSKIHTLDNNPEKMEEARGRMIALSKIGAELQSNYQKRNLLSWMNSSDIDSTNNILDTIKKLERAKLRIMRFAEVKDSEKIPHLSERQEILKWKNSLEKLKASDILMLKKQWADLVQLLLVPENDSFTQVSRETLKKDDKFIVNFGENKDGKNNIDNVIGAGDILPSTVKKIKINGVEGERKDFPTKDFPNVKRPWYYDVVTKKYLPIHDGDIIEIIEIGTADEKAGEAEDAWFRKNRINDLAREEWDFKPELQEDIALMDEVNAEKERRKKFIEQFGSTSSGKDVIESNKFRIWNDDFGDVCNITSLSMSEIPVIQSIMSSIGKQESWSNYAIFWVELNSGEHHWDRALGRYQIMPKNWIAWGNKFYWKTLEYTPENQDKIAFAQISEYFMKHKRENPDLSYIIWEISKDWYGRGSAPTGFPNTEKYAQSVISIYNSQFLSV